ncbi:DUF3575 domain-containing protein [Elizabethkingia anophelis]|uniref:DUF3575 domain-containing protein n=1 Tax=Elizabethkingia anophelis TaxID=1117645 RepID=UPI0032088029
MRNSLTILVMLVLSKIAYSQENKHLIKGNVLFAPIGVFNIGYEYIFNHHWTGQTDLFISIWRSISEKQLQLGMGHMEVRYYFSEAPEKWYIGANIGMSVFNTQKLNYWNTLLSREGYNVMLGTTIGYQIKIADRWNLDLFLSGGNAQSFYHILNKSTSSLESYNASAYRNNAEWTLYRGGVMVSYGF